MAGGAVRTACTYVLIVVVLDEYSCAIPVGVVRSGVRAMFSASRLRRTAKEMPVEGTMRGQVA
jgi:hypothetical protein